MNNQDIIAMAREAGLDPDLWNFTDAFERFAALVAAAERNRTWTQEHWTEYERSIAAAEREACAKVCGKLADEALSCGDEDAVMCFEEAENAIRARGQA